MRPQREEENEWIEHANNDTNTLREYEYEYDYDDSGEKQGLLCVAVSRLLLKAAIYLRWGKGDQILLESS